MKDPFDGNILRVKESYYWINEWESLLIPEVCKVNKWVEVHIFDKIETNSEKTEDVLVRIAVGMINKLPICDVNKRFLHENLITNRKAARVKWNVYALKDCKGLPF